MVGISWTRERSAAVSAAGEGSDEIGVCRGPRVVGMESKASVLGTPRRCTLDSSDSCERRAACAARSVASRWAAALSITGWRLVLGFLPPPSPGWLGASDAANMGGAKRGQEPRVNRLAVRGAHQRTWRKVVRWGDVKKRLKG